MEGGSGRCVPSLPPLDISSTLRAVPHQDNHRRADNFAIKLRKGALRTLQQRSIHVLGGNLLRDGRFRESLRRSSQKPAGAAYVQDNWILAAPDVSFPSIRWHCS